VTMDYSIWDAIQHVVYNEDIKTLTAWNNQRWHWATV